MAMQMVRAGFGVSFLPRSILATHPYSNIYTKPIKGMTVLSCPTLVWSDDLYYATCVKQFLELAKNYTWNPEESLRRSAAQSRREEVKSDKDFSPMS
jgi:DNA-binding transcriptional LysR family regulator